MVILRSAVYTGILAFIYRWLRGGKCGIIPLATVFMIGNVLSHYPNERPQLFAYAFMTILLFLLERLNKSGEENNKYHTIGLPLLMLVWANCHGSFILG